MSNNMKEIIDSLKAQNGNVNVTQKDMLWYLVHKVDNIHDRINKQVSHCNGIFATRKLLFTVTTISIMLVVGTITVIANI